MSSKIPARGEVPHGHSKEGTPNSSAKKDVSRSKGEFPIFLVDLPSEHGPQILEAKIPDLPLENPETEDKVQGAFPRFSQAIRQLSSSGAFALIIVLFEKKG
jgi:hypothetical protein